MTKKEFNSTGFKVGMEAKYRDCTVDILGVDFQQGWVCLDYVGFWGETVWRRRVMTIHLQYLSKSLQAYYCTWMDGDKEVDGYLTLEDLRYEKDKKVEMFKHNSTIH